jgi:hypothetical protein
MDDQSGSQFVFTIPWLGPGPTGQSAASRAQEACYVDRLYERLYKMGKIRERADDLPTAHAPSAAAEIRPFL